MTGKYHNRRSQTSSWHHEEEKRQKTDKDTYMNDKQPALSTSHNGLIDNNMNRQSELKKITS